MPGRSPRVASLITAGPSTSAPAALWTREKRLGGNGREAGAILAQKLLAQVGQVHGAKHVHAACTHVEPDVLDHGDAGARVRIPRLAEATAGGNRAVDGLDHVGEVDRFGGFGEPVAAVGAANALYQAGLSEVGHDLLEKALGDLRAVGDDANLDRLVRLAVDAEVEHGLDAVLAFG